MCLLRPCSKQNRRLQSPFKSLTCGYGADADINGARNIITAGHAVLVCGGTAQSGCPLKQEPANVSRVAT